MHECTVHCMLHLQDISGRINQIAVKINVTCKLICENTGNH